MKLISRAAYKRLAVLALLIFALLAYGYVAMIHMPLKSFSAQLPPMTSAQSEISKKLRQHLEALARDIGERNTFIPKKLQSAQEYVERSFAATGLQVSRQEFEVTREKYYNLEVEIPGRSHREEIVVVGAHYDSVSGSPGANDNGSGAASLLVLAELLARAELSRTLRFVAFVNEEPPHFQTESMGSWVYARRCHQRKEQVVAMITLETMGYYSDAAKTQHYPPPMGMMYPNTGNFIAFVGNTRSGKLVRQCIRSFRTHAKFPSEGAALPGFITGVGWSDHWAFWQEGYSGIMITDTAPFRYPFYHTIQDTPDKIDYDRLARVTEGLKDVILDLALAR